MEDIFSKSVYGIECHTFNVSLATRIGLNESLMLQHFLFWHKYNLDKEEMFKDGRVWFFMSAAKISNYFPYLTQKKIRGAIEHLIVLGLVTKGDYNKDKLNRTSWYSLNDSAIDLMNGTQTSNIPILQNVTPCDKKETHVTKWQLDSNNIDSNNNNIYCAKTKNKDELFEKAWVLYERKGSKKKAFEQWNKLSQENRERAIKFIPQYKASNPEIKFRKDFERYISYEVWVDARTMDGEKQYNKETLGEGVYIMDGKKYFGKILIPYDTPKRPSTRHSWNAEDNRWEY